MQDWLSSCSKLNLVYGNFKSSRHQINRQMPYRLLYCYICTCISYYIEFIVCYYNLCIVYLCNSAWSCVIFLMYVNIDKLFIIYYVVQIVDKHTKGTLAISKQSVRQSSGATLQAMMITGGRHSLKAGQCVSIHVWYSCMCTGTQCFDVTDFNLVYSTSFCTS